jgi:hypothetical protein
VTEERAGRWLQSTVIPALTGMEVPAMSNHPTATSKGAWRILVLDPSHDDPMWVVATVVELADVRPASPADTAPGELTTRWVASRAGLARVELTQLRHATVWLVGEES